MRTELKKLFTSVLVLGAFLFIAFGSLDGEVDPNNSVDARVKVWESVQRRLKDPGSADFGLCDMIETSSGSWKTNSYVDAKNGFGGTIRTYFSCEVKLNSSGSWELVNLQMD